MTTDLAIFAAVLIVGYFGITTMVRWVAFGFGFVFATWLANSAVGRVAIVGLFAYVLTQAGVSL